MILVMDLVLFNGDHNTFEEKYLGYDLPRTYLFYLIPS